MEDLLLRLRCIDGLSEVLAQARIHSSKCTFPSSLETPCLNRNQPAFTASGRTRQEPSATAAASASLG